MFEDIKSIFKNDPAARGLEPLLYPGLHAIILHRYLSHPLYKLRLKCFFIVTSVSKPKQMAQVKCSDNAITLSLKAFAIQTIPLCDQTGVPIHFHSSTTSGSASWVILRMFLNVAPRQSGRFSTKPSISLLAFIS